MDLNSSVKEIFFLCDVYLILPELLCSALLSCWLVLGIRSNVTGKLETSCLQTSQILFPFTLNHLIAHSSWTSLRSPLQLHSIWKVLPSSHAARQILQTASSSGISRSSFSGAGVISFVHFNQILRDWSRGKVKY